MFENWNSNLFLNWIEQYSVSIVLSLLVILLYSFTVRFALPKIERGVDSSKLKKESKDKATQILRLVFAIVSTAILLAIWGIDFSGLLLISTSLITLTGVALFASWSLLSNITAYFVILFQHPFRRGNFVRILDADNYIEGFIAEVNLFSVKLITVDRQVILYPNNLVLTRPTIVNPKTKWQGIGKVVTHPKPANELPASTVE